MYKGRKVLVLGGFGFIGLNLLRKLLEQEALVTVLDIRDEVPLKSLRKINYQKGDLRDSAHLRRLLYDQEIVFNLAGRSGPGNSNQDPREDLEVNCLGALNVLEVARQLNTEIKIVFPGSRLEYGKVTHLPVTEKTEMRPTSIYGIHKLTAEKYHLAYYDNFGLRTTVLRISNPYGPHLPQPNPGYNIINFFFDEALRGQILRIFGDGSQKRDYLFIEDLVDLFLLVGLEKKTDGQVYNVGLGRGVSLLTMAETIVKVVGKGRIKKEEWDTASLKVETGDYVSDISKVAGATGWKPVTDIREGIQKTLTDKSNPFWEPKA